MLKSVSILLLAAAPAFAAGRAITTDDLLPLGRSSEPQLSPDGARVVYTVGVPDMNANRVARNLWIASMNGGESKALTSTGRDGGARWAPDGRRIAFVSSRDGAAQIYVMSIDAPGEAKKITDVSGGANNVVWAPDGRRLRRAAARARRAASDRLCTRQPHDLLHRDHRCRGGDQHERGSVRDRRQRRPTEAAHHESGIRRRAGVLAGWHAHRVPLA